MADILAEKFTVGSYDRRCNSRSSGDRSDDMTVAEQARDAASVIKAMGVDKAIVLGGSKCYLVLSYSFYHISGTWQLSFLTYLKEEKDVS